MLFNQFKVDLNQLLSQCESRRDDPDPHARRSLFQAIGRPRTDLVTEIIHNHALGREGVLANPLGRAIVEEPVLLGEIVVQGRDLGHQKPIPLPDLSQDGG